MVNVNLESAQRIFNWFTGWSSGWGLPGDGWYQGVSIAHQIVITSQYYVNPNDWRSPDNKILIIYRKSLYREPDRITKHTKSAFCIIHPH